jgi:signal peptidase I
VRFSRAPKGPVRPKGALRETVESLAYAVVIFLVIRTLAFQAFRIPTGSMEETLLPGDFLFINKFAYGARVPFTDLRLPGYAQPRRGDIIVFEYPKDKKVDYIKRCVAVAGQTVEVRNKQLFVDGAPAEEPFVVHKDPSTGVERGDPRFERDNWGPYKVPAGCLFMMGDNRDYSADSRFWGPLPVNLIHGRAWVTYFSWDPKGHLPRPKRMFRLIH